LPDPSTEPPAQPAAENPPPFTIFHDGNLTALTPDGSKVIDLGVYFGLATEFEGRDPNDPFDTGYTVNFRLIGTTLHIPLHVYRRLREVIAATEV